MKKYTLLILIILFLIGCVAREFIPRNYYILEYYQHSEDKKMKQDEPIDCSVLVQDTDIPRTYSRKQIVVRHFGPKITYSDNDIWAVKLQNIIPNLITKRLNRYNLFTRVQREFLDEHPKYVISSKINNIELFKSEYLMQARLNISFSFSESDEGTLLVRHSVDREKKLLDENVETFVQTINDILLTETDNFIQKILNHFEGIKPEEITKDKAKISDISLVEIEKQEEISGMGLLLLPAITRTGDEPYYKIYDKLGEEVSGKMGEAIPLSAGEYSIKYGSGSESQKMNKGNIEIVPRYKKIVEPDWGCLTVDIIDENRNFVKMQYELFQGKTGASYGTEFTKEEGVGEHQKIWILEPGRYKITINNEPFNTYQDFTTVYVEKGEYQEIMLVVGTGDDGNPTNLVGAGVLEEEELLASEQKLKFSSAIHGNVNFSSNKESEEGDYQTTLTLNSQFDNKLIYDEFPFHYTLKNLVEVGITKEADDFFGDMKISSDDFDLKNTLIYYFIKDLGIYTRVDLNSHLFPENEYLDDDTTKYKKIDIEGNLVNSDTTKLVDEIQVKKSFFPLTLKEGLGINYRILNYAKANLNLRAGFGLQQVFNNDVYKYDKPDEYDYKIYLEEESIYTKGTEVSLIGTFQLPFNLTYTLDADFLFPFEKDESITMEWENIFNLRLFKFISINYKLKLKLTEDEQFVSKDHTLFLRATYFLR
ncbi:MAG: membrane integrity-associated transporter subunit PqiC [Candidatus Cloacimonetes bacterium]|nr:membrane integrity-associated transporter subunit PqiC [Candidatus Cloacimonadota bacterium]